MEVLSAGVGDIRRTLLASCVLVLLELTWQ